MASTKWIHPYYWSIEKSEYLKKIRGISFDDIIEYVSGEHLLEDKPHHNTEQYSHQRLLIVDIEWYVWYIPYVIQDDDTYFLKTIIPSRMYTREYKK